MDFTTIEVDSEGMVGHITLNRPDKLNPLSTTTLLELVGAAAHFDAQPEVTAVVVGGRGRAFSAGADLSAFSGENTGAARQREAADAGRQMADAIESMRAVTVARIHGHCVGGGVVLAAACDLRIATTTARFSIPEVALGIPLAWGGIPRLTREIGPAMTKELVMTCRPFGADEACALGFVNRVVDDDQLDRAVDELVGQLVDKSPLTLEATKRATNAATQELVSTANAWSDADALVTALHDRASRDVAAAYLARLSERREV
jgi:enoyl-CoA hydratase/carnithine racemase